MSKTSSRDDLMRRLRRRMESERRQIEDLTARELRRLGESLSAARSAALRSIESDTEQAAARMRQLLLKAWLRPLVVGLSLFIGFSAGSWATMHWLSRGIQHRSETLGELDLRIEDARGMLAEIEKTTWGVTLREVGGAGYVTLPPGTTVRTSFSVDGRPYVELSRK